MVVLTGLGLAGLLPAQPTARSEKGRVIAGQVLDDAGKPVAGATVKLVSGPYPGLPAVIHDFLPRRVPASEAVARADESGRFRITVRDRHMICLYAEDGTDHARRMSAPIVPVLPGDYRVLTLRKAVAVRGVVRGLASGAAEDKPITGATVHGSIQTAPPSGFTVASFTLGVQAVTGKDGAYRLWVPAGCSVTLEAESAGYEAQKAVITPGPDHDLVLGAGRVLKGVAQGPDGKPVAGALLQDPYLPRCRTRTDAAGRFELVLSRNRYWVHVAHPQLAHGVDYTRQASRVRRPKAAGNSDRQQPARILRLRKGTRLRARILGPGGRPLPRARVVLAGMPRRLSHRSGSLSKIVAWPCRLDQAGILDVSCLYQGYVAYAWVEVDGEFVELFSGDVGGGIDFGDVKLPLSGTVSGIVQLPSRMPAAGARVLFRRRFDNPPANLRNMQIPLPFQEAVADRGGRFRLDGVRPGTYDLAVVVANHFPRLIRAKVASKEQTLRITLPQGKTLQGTLVDSDNRPVPHRPIRIFMQNARAQLTHRRFGFQWFEPITDNNGRFAYHGLPDGEMYRVYVYFRVDGQTYRGNPIQNIEPGARNLELMLTTPMPSVGVGR